MDDSVLALLRHFANHCAGADSVESPAFLMAASAVDYAGPMHNAAIRKTSDCAPGPFLETARAYFRGRKRRFVLWIAGHSDGDLAEAALTQGFQPRPGGGGSAGMIIHDRVRAVPAPHVELSPVTTARDVQTFGGLVADAFAARESPQPREASRALFRPPEVILHPRVSAYLAVSQGAACGTAMTYIDGGVANICWISTHPDYRRRGIAGALTARCVEEGRRRGADQVVLQSSTDGEPLYRNLGFTELTRYHRFLSPAIEEND